MSINSFLQVVVAFMFGDMCAYSHLPFTNWRFWVLLVLFLVYGRICCFEGIQEGANGPDA